MDSEEENLERRLNSIFTIILLFLVSQLILERFSEMLLVVSGGRKLRATMAMTLGVG